MGRAEIMGRKRKNQKKRQGRRKGVIFCIPIINSWICLRFTAEVLVT